MDGPGAVRIALDQNFPTPIIDCIAPFIPDVAFDHVQKIDPRLCQLDDWQLIVALHRRGYRALASNDYHMIDEARVASAAAQTKTSLILIESLGDDPIRATGALLLDVAWIAKRLPPRKSAIYRIRRNNPRPMMIREVLEERAEHMGISVDELRGREQLTRAELDDPLV